jgi:hypothetical protein
MNPQVLKAFTPRQLEAVSKGLQNLAMQLTCVPGGCKVEEDYWARIYRDAKGVGKDSWSNLSFKDYIHEGLGVEWKLLRRSSPHKDQGRCIMHPAATRTIDYDPSETAENCKQVILSQWAERITEFKERVRATSPDRNTADIRWGVLLWSPKFDEYLYFEEEILVPVPSDFYAVWHNGNHRGKPTRNLWIYERETNVKKFSVTLPKNGAKIQPYFNIPTAEEGAYLFKFKKNINKRMLALEGKAHDLLVKSASSACETPSEYLQNRLPCEPRKERNMKNNTLRFIIFIAFIILLFGGSFIVGQCSKSEAAAPGVWVCLAVTDKTLEPDYDCEAKGYSRNKKRAEEKALEKCEDKCYAECKVEACIRRR